MKGTAQFDDTKKYRYLLERRWSDAPALLACMLNPSVADAEKNDKTINQLIHFATREGHGALVVVNLFARITPYPEELAAVSDPIGPMNDNVITAAAVSCRSLLVAWGGSFPGPLKQRRIREVSTQLSKIFGRPFCLGMTQCLNPRHPSRLAHATPFQPFKWES